MQALIARMRTEYLAAIEQEKQSLGLMSTKL
jgi:hypothetical protein